MEIPLHEPEWFNDSLNKGDHDGWPLEKLRAGRRSRIEAHATSRAQPFAEDICTHCRRIDFEYLFFGGLETGYRHNLMDKVVVATLEEVDTSAAAGCPLCNHIFRPAAEEMMQRRRKPELFSNRDRVNILLFASDYQHRNDYDLDRRDHGYSAVRIFIQLPDTPNKAETECPNGLLQLRDHPLSRYRVIEREVDLDICKGWLNECQASHQQCTISTPGKSASDVGMNPAFKVIDINANRIVQTGDKLAVSYAALSYVCGRSSDMWKLPRKSELWKQDAEGYWTFPMPQHIPDTVADAMTVAKAMGLQYLWVDSFCIAQDDPEELQSQIQAMHKVYSRATFCIVAATSKSSTDGIAGVGFPRSLQLGQRGVAVKSGFTIGRERSPFEEIIKEGIYMKRGWTFQELLLSRRCLILTEQEVHYFCAGMTMCESRLTKTEEELASIWTGEHLKVGRYFIGNASLIQRHCESGRPDAAYMTWHAAVGEYSTRNLSFESDGLNAFQGLSLFIGKHLKTEMLFGCPHKFLVNALSWHAKVFMPFEFFRDSVRRVENTMSVTQRPLLPSWTWASYTGSRRVVTLRPISESTETLVMSTDLLPDVAASCAMERHFMTVPAARDPSKRVIKGVLPLLTKMAVLPVFIEDEEFPYIVDIDVPQRFGHGSRCEADSSDWRPHKKKIVCIQLWVACRGTDDGDVEVLMLHLHDLPSYDGSQGDETWEEVLGTNKILTTAESLTYQTADESRKRVLQLPPEYDELGISTDKLQNLPQPILATRAGNGKIDLDVWLSAKPKDALVLLG